MAGRPFTTRFTQLSKKTQNRWHRRAEEAGYGRGGAALRKLNQTNPQKVRALESVIESYHAPLSIPWSTGAPGGAHIYRAGKATGRAAISAAELFIPGQGLVMIEPDPITTPGLWGGEAWEWWIVHYTQLPAELFVPAYRNISTKQTPNGYWVLYINEESP